MVKCIQAQVLTQATTTTTAASCSSSWFPNYRTSTDIQPFLPKSILKKHVHKMRNNSFSVKVGGILHCGSSILSRWSHSTRVGMKEARAYAKEMSPAEYLIFRTIDAGKSSGIIRFHCTWVVALLQARFSPRYPPWTWHLKASNRLLPDDVLCLSFHQKRHKSLQGILMANRESAYNRKITCTRKHLNHRPKLSALPALYRDETRHVYRQNN